MLSLVKNYKTKQLNELICIGGKSLRILSRTNLIQYRCSQLKTIENKNIDTMDKTLETMIGNIPEKTGKSFNLRKTLYNLVL